MAWIEVPEALRAAADGAGAFDTDASTAGDALDALCARHPALRARLLDADGALRPDLALRVNGADLARDGLRARRLGPADRIAIVGSEHGDAGGGDDVRMRGFRRRCSVEAALAAALDGLSPRPAESVGLDDATGRVLSEPVCSAADVPAFARSAMDGWAVRAEDTFGASLYDPIPLGVLGESMPGVAPDVRVGPHGCVRIMTGAPLPDGADAVLPAECGDERDGRVLVRDAVTPGKNVGRPGEDVRRGTTVLAPGRRLRPQDVGLLASVGASRVAVVARPRVRIVVSGNELLAPGEPPAGARIADSNTPMLRALVARDGGTVVEALRVADDPDAIRDAVVRGGADVVLAAGGTSVGREDHLPQVVRAAGHLAVHGVAMRPSSPAGVGTVGGARVLLLPGNPVSCLAAYDFFAGPAIRRLAGLPEGSPYVTRRARLTRRIASMLGRTDYCRVVCTPDGAEPLAVAGASVLSSTTRADGFVVVPAGSEGFPEGAEVTVHLYDAPAGGPLA